MLVGQTSREQGLGAIYRVGFGHYLRDLRLSRGLTQRDLAKRIDVTSSAISAIEVGRNFPPPARCVALAEALDVSFGEFGKQVLRWQNPWLFSMLYLKDAKRAFAEIDALLDRSGVPARGRRRRAGRPTKDTSRRVA